MAVLQFPATPSLNETYSLNGVIYKWNGTYWEANVANSDFDDRYVQKTGDLMVGQLGLPGGGSATEALQKQEVQALITSADTPDLQAVTDEGNTTTNDVQVGGITAAGDIVVEGSDAPINLTVGTADDNAAGLAVKYSSVPAYITNSYDGSVGLSTFSNNSYDKSDGSQSWSTSTNVGYGTSAIQLVATSGNTSQIRFRTQASGTSPAPITAVLNQSGNFLIGGTLPAAPNIELKANGSSTFAGNIQVAGFPEDGAADGAVIRSSGAIQASRAAGSTLWAGYKTGTTTYTTRIDSNGNITAAGSLEVGRGDQGNTKLLRVRSLASANSGRTGIELTASVDGVETPVFEVKGDGSITAAGQLKIEGPSIPSGFSTRISKYGSLLVGTTSDSIAGARCSIDSGNGNILTEGVVSIGGTDAANTISEYETGSWTPALVGDATYSVQVGTYVRIGNICKIHWRLAVDQINSAEKIGRIQNLPFNSNKASQVTGAVNWGNLSSGISYALYTVEANTNLMQLISATGSQTTLTSNPEVFQNGTSIIGSMVYEINS